MIVCLTVVISIQPIHIIRHNNSISQMWGAAYRFRKLLIEIFTNLKQNIQIYAQFNVK